MKKAFIPILLLLLVGAVLALGQSESPVESQRAVVNNYCVVCHDDDTSSGGFSWESVDLTRPEMHTQELEMVIRKVRAGMMPPVGMPRPDAKTLDAFVTGLESRIDRVAAQNPNTKAPPLHRLNRTEYRNSVRELLDYDVDVSGLLPADPKAGSFDNLADALTITPALMQGYVRAAEKISREAVGDPNTSSAMVGYNDVNQVGKAANQFRRVPGAPFGTRGGISVIHNFPADGEYIFKAALAYHPQGQLIGARLPDSIKDQQLEVSIDGERAHLFTIDTEVKEYEGDLFTPPIKVKAGPRRVSVVFLKKFDGPVQDQFWLVEQLLLDATVSGHPEMTALPHLKNFWITGPMDVTGIAETPSRRKIFSCRPATPSGEPACAAEIISRLAGQAYRRPATPEDLEALMPQYEVGRKNGTFEGGIQTALQAILLNMEFIFRFERTPPGVGPGEAYRISDLELASRLSYFLWSSSPDDELITLASEGKLKDPAVLEQQVKRMLKDPRSSSLVENFAGQWLRLGSLIEITPESLIYPNFTRNLAHSMRREVEMLFDSVIREDRNILDLMTADYTFVDEVLAQHYGIPNIVGPRFQRVRLTDPNRFGLLGKGGILVMTALPNRTSPVIRGKYVLEVLLGTPPPLPPANVPPFKEAGDFETVQSVRARLEQHREVEPCRSCHQIMDPIGIAMENFDPVGLWRAKDHGHVIDPADTMYDGTPLSGPVSVRDAVLKHSDLFDLNFAEQLLTYGLGRVVDYRDKPVIRSIARDAARNGNRFSAFVMGVIKSPSFQMSRREQTEQ